jgi:hypothetical protein
MLDGLDNASIEMEEAKVSFASITRVMHDYLHIILLLSLLFL